MSGGKSAEKEVLFTVGKSTFSKAGPFFVFAFFFFSFFLFFFFLSQFLRETSISILDCSLIFRRKNIYFFSKFQSFFFFSFIYLLKQLIETIIEFK